MGEARGLDGDAETDHMPEEDIRDGAIQMILVVAVVVAGDKVEPVLRARGPQGDFRADIGRYIPLEQRRCRYGSHQLAVFRVVAEAQVEVALIFVQHFKGKVVVDGTLAETSGQLGCEVAAESMRISGEDVTDAARETAIVAVGPVLESEEDIVGHRAVAPFPERVIDIYSGGENVALEWIGRLVYLPDRQLGISEE